MSYSRKQIMTKQVDVPNLVTYLNQTPIFMCYVVRCGSKNGYQKRHVEKKLDSAQKITTLSSNTQHNGRREGACMII